jgi:MFS family permease
VLALLTLRVEEPRFEREEHHFIEELLAGARHIASTLPLRQIVLATGLCLLFVGFSETVIFAVMDQGLHRSPSFFGVLSSLQGVGAIAGGLTAARTLRRIGDVKLVGFGMGLFAAGELSFVSSSLPLVLVGIAVAGAGIAWFIVGFATAIQLRTPARLQGRVAGAAETLVGTPQTVSIAVGAALVTIVDYRAMVVLSCFMTAVCGLYLLSRRAIVPVETTDDPALAA